MNGEDLCALLDSLAAEIIPDPSYWLRRSTPELIGSHHASASLALRVRVLGRDVTPNLMECVLQGYQHYPLRSLCVECMVVGFVGTGKRAGEHEALREGAGNGDKGERLAEHPQVRGKEAVRVLGNVDQRVECGGDQLGARRVEELANARADKVMDLQVERPVNWNAQLEHMALVLCEALMESVRNNGELQKWRETWFWGADPEVDKNAKNMQNMAREFGRRAFPLMSALQMCVANVDQFESTMLVEKIWFVCAAWLGSDAKRGGIEIPWGGLQDMSEMAQRCADEALSKSPDNTKLSCERLRDVLKNEAWSKDWFTCPALVYACLNLTELNSPIKLEGAEDHLLPILLSMATDIDPRITEPAWRCVATLLLRDVVLPRDAGVVFQTLERAMSVRDVPTFTQVMRCLNLALIQFPVMTVGNGIAEDDEQRFIERLSRDLYYASTLNQDLYIISINEALVPAISRVGVLCIRLLSQLLAGVEAGVSRRSLIIPSLHLFNAVLKACRPRVFAHRGHVFALLVRFVALRKEKDFETKREIALAFSLFRECLTDFPEHQHWFNRQIDHVRADGNAKLIEKLNGLL